MVFSSFLQRSQMHRKVRGARHRHAGRRTRFETLEDRRMMAFAPAVSYGVGPAPQDVVAADFNGDNRLDLATANAGSNTVSVLLGNANGTFQAARTSAVGANPVSLAVGDFNGDGKLDLAAINGGASGVNVMFGNRDGTFQAPTHIAVGWTAESLASGDFNGDGKMDLVVISNDRPPNFEFYPEGRADVLLSMGGGSFSAPRTFWGFHRAFGSAVVTDFNSDGKLDLVTEMPDYSSTIVLLGDGNGNIGTNPNAGWIAAVSTNPSAAGDLNGDGKTDLVSAPRWWEVAPSVGVMFGDGYDRCISQGATYYPIDNYANSAILGDFDHDGTLDIGAAIPATNEVSILRNPGNGIFVATEDFATGSGAYAVVAGDFNGDGWLDLATANATGNRVSILLNNQSWSEVPSAISVSDATVTEGNTGTNNATFTVTLSKATNVDVTVRYATANGSAVAGSDYTAKSGTVTIPAGQTSRTFSVAVLGDRLVEPTETFYVNLSSPTNATIADGQAIGTILDNEPRISINDVSQNEGHSKTTTFTFTVRLSTAYDQTVTVNYATAGGTATAGSDYQSKSGSLTFAAGEITKTITVTVIGDKTNEANETFFVNLSGAVGGAITDSQGLGTIWNDDSGGSKGKK